MSHPAQHDVRVLNGLIQATLDSADGYREAARETETEAYRRVFETHASERREIVDQLQETVRLLGGQARDDGSILAKAHRAFLDVKHALLRDEQAVVNSVENGEDQLDAKYQRAVADADISATTRETIRRLHARVALGRDRMRDLRQRLEAEREAKGPGAPL